MTVRILTGDCREVLKAMDAGSVHCCVTSPPYWGLRQYGESEQMGLEQTLDEYVENLVEVFAEVHRVLKDDGTVFLNLGDCYAGSGRGGKPDAGTKQGTNRGSQTVGVLYGLDDAGRVNERARIKAQSQSLLDVGLKPKDLVGVPWEVAFALRRWGWYLRDAVCWAKPNSMPGSQEDRCTSSYEMIFQLSKSRTYWSDFDAIKTPPRESSLIRTAQDVQAQAGSHRANGGTETNGPMKAIGVRSSDKQRGHSRRHNGFNDRWDLMERSEQQSRPAMMRNVWFVATASFREGHYAVMPDEVARRCILAGCPEGGTVLDPFGGAGTTGLVADRLGRNAILIELNCEYAEMARKRIAADAGLFAEVSA